MHTLPMVVNIIRRYCRTGCTKN